MKFDTPFTELAQKFLTFAGVGVFGTIAHYAVLIVAIEQFDIQSVAGSSVGFIVGAFVNYALNYHYTFRSNRRHLEALPRFLLIATVGFLFNGAIMWYLAESLEINYLLSQITATALVLLWTFTANLVWTFPGRNLE